MPAPLSVHDAIDQAWDKPEPIVATPDPEQTVEAVASIVSALRDLTIELDEKKPRKKDGANLLWWSIAEVASQRDYGVPIEGLTIVPLTELFNKMLGQLKAAPSGVGGATATGGAAVAPTDLESSDGIPD